MPLRRKEFRTSCPKKDERKAERGKKIAGKGKNPFEKGLFPFPRTPIPFPKTFIITSGFPVLRVHEQRFLPPRRLPDAHAIAKLKLHSIALRPSCPVCTRHAVRPASLARRRLRLTAGVNSACLCPTCSFSEYRHVPFAQDTLYGLRNLHDGGCV